MVTQEYFIHKRKFTTSYIITRRKNVYLVFSLCNHVLRCRYSNESFADALFNFTFFFPLKFLAV